MPPHTFSNLFYVCPLANHVFPNFSFCIPKIQLMIVIIKHLLPFGEDYIRPGFPGGTDGKESVCNVGDLGSIPGFGGFPGEGKSYPLQCSCLENPRDGGAWWAASLGSHRFVHD